MDGGFDTQCSSKWNFNGCPSEHRHGSWIEHDGGGRHRQFSDWRQLQLRRGRYKPDKGPRPRFVGVRRQSARYLVSFTNNTGLSIAQFTITYDGEQWRIGQASSAVNVLMLQYSSTGLSGSWVALGSGFNFNSPITSAAAGMALDGNAAANRISGIGGTYTSTSQIANGASFYLRWADPDDGGSDNAVAIDSLSISFSLVPEPDTWERSLWARSYARNASASQRC